MSDDERELLRLQVLLALWPEQRSREEFGTELHLKRAVADAYDRVFPVCANTGAAFSGYKAAVQGAEG